MSKRNPFLVCKRVRPTGVDAYVPENVYDYDCTHDSFELWVQLVLIKSRRNQLPKFSRDPTSEYNYEFDERGRWVGTVYNDNPKHELSWRCVYDSIYHDTVISYTVADDPKHSCSWVAEFDSKGKCIARTYGENPEDPYSWKESVDASEEETD